MSPDARHLGANRFLLSGRHQPVQTADAARREVEAGPIYRGPVGLLEVIVSAVADAAAVAAATQIQDLEAIEDHILADRGDDDQGRLTAIRQRSVQPHRQLSGLRAIFHRIERESPDRLPPLLLETAARIAQRLSALADDIVAAQQQARLLQDEIDSKMASRVNRLLYILSVITALF
jgi:zinc transporter